MIIIDAKEKNCPIPVILAKKEMDGGNADFAILVDNEIAVKNLTRLADSLNYSIHVQESPGEYKVFLSTECAECGAILPSKETLTAGMPVGAPAKTCYSVLVSKETIGEGSGELGMSLMKMFFFTLSESDDLPESILFMNGGVKLASQDEQVISHLKVLAEKGVEILVCGTCINYFELPADLPVGTISNMYSILEAMQKASKVITL